jgi:hypothetical protein
VLLIGVAPAGAAGRLVGLRTWLLCIRAAALVLRLAFAHRLGVASASSSDSQSFGRL